MLYVDIYDRNRKNKLKTCQFEQSPLTGEIIWIDRSPAPAPPGTVRDRQRYRVTHTEWLVDASGIIGSASLDVFVREDPE